MPEPDCTATLTLFPEPESMDRCTHMRMHAHVYKRVRAWMGGCYSAHACVPSHARTCMSTFTRTRTQHNETALATSV
jgi:hypothetical protein